MNSELLANNPAPIVAAIFIAFMLLEIACARFRQPAAKRRDAMVEILGSGILLLITFPLIVLTTHQLLSHFAPDLKGLLVDLPWYCVIAST